MNDRRIIVLGTLNERVMKGSLVERGLKERLYDVAQFANLRYHTGLIHFIHYLMEISVFMVSEGYV